MLSDVEILGGKRLPLCSLDECYIVNKDPNSTKTKLRHAVSTQSTASGPSTSALVAPPLGPLPAAVLVMARGAPGPALPQVAKVLRPAVLLRVVDELVNT